MTLNCLYAGLCSGCDRPYWNRSQVENARVSELRALGLITEGGPIPNFVHIDPPQGLRDRVEVTIQRVSSATYRIGLYALAHSLEVKRQRDLLDLPGCSQLSPELEAFYRDLRSDPPPVSRIGTARLRIGPKGQRGLWLDYANEDIRDLLHDGTWVDRAFARNWIVEMGQKRKRVQRGDDRYKLSDPVLEPWFQTLNSKGQPVDLYSTIGTFTQPGIRANFELVKAVQAQVTHSRVLEFGCGVGNFTLALASPGRSISVFETDSLALEGLKRSFDSQGLPNPTIHLGDFIQKSQTVSFQEAESRTDSTQGYATILVDPPRSGLGRFLEILQNPAARAANWVYVSCFPETLAKDVATLTSHGLKLESLHVIEQFPFTRHFEVLATLRAPSGP